MALSPPPSSIPLKILVAIIVGVLAVGGVAAYIVYQQYFTPHVRERGGHPAGAGAGGAIHYQVVEVSDLKDLLNLVSAMETRYSVNGKEMITSSFEVVGSEEVGGVECW